MATVTHVHDITNETVADPSQDGDIMDNEMDSSSGATNKGTGTEILIGKTGCGGKSCDHRRSLHHFDMLQVIHPSAVITAAELWLYVTGYAIDMTPDGYARFYADRLKRQDWVESESTHNNYKSGSAWTTAGAESTLTDRDSNVRDELTGLNPGYTGTADAQVTTTTGPPGTLTDGRDPGWTTDEFANGHWLCMVNGDSGWQQFVIASNSSKTITGTGGWSGGGNPGDGYAYYIVHNTAHGWWSPSILNIVQDAQNNQGGKVHFRVARLDTINKTAWITYTSKEGTAANRPHLRVTYTLADRTYQVVLR